MICYINLTPYYDILHKPDASVWDQLEKFCFEFSLIYVATLQVAALQFGDFYNVQYVKMYTFFMIQLQVILKTFTIFLLCK
jgi:hypothetical protein